MADKETFVIEDENHLRQCRKNGRSSEANEMTRNWQLISAVSEDYVVNKRFRYRTVDLRGSWMDAKAEGELLQSAEFRGLDDRQKEYFRINKLHFVQENDQPDQTSVTVQCRIVGDTISIVDFNHGEKKGRARERHDKIRVDLVPFDQDEANKEPYPAGRLTADDGRLTTQIYLPSCQVDALVLSMREAVVRPKLTLLLQMLLFESDEDAAFPEPLEDSSYFAVRGQHSIDSKVILEEIGIELDRSAPDPLSAVPRSPESPQRYLTSQADSTHHGRREVAEQLLVRLHHGIDRAVLALWTGVGAFAATAIFYLIWLTESGIGR